MRYLMKKFFIFGGLLILLAISFTGCAGTRVSKPEEAVASPYANLDIWLETRAFDRIVGELRTNSFMKGAPFIIVKAKGEAVGQNISHQIDLLTEAIRSRLVSLLLEYPDIKYVRRHPISILDRPYQLQDLKCGRFIEPEMLLAIDMIRFGPIEAHTARITIRAIDLKKDDWIEGFSLHQPVLLTPQQSRDLNSIHPDEYLRGTKYAPFLETQRAEMAAQLAGNLSCIFKEGYSGDDIHIFVDSSGTKRKHRDVVWFIKKQLQFCNEIQLVKEKKNADAVLVAGAKETGKGTGIGQFWIDVYKKKGGEMVKGLATFAHFAMGEDQPPSLIGRWEVINLPSRTTAGYLEIVGVSEHGYRANLFEIDGSTLRKAGIGVSLYGNDIEWSYYDDQLEKTFSIKGLLMKDREKMAVKVTAFPLTKKAFNQELLRVE